MKTILFLTDCTEQSNRILNYAVEMARLLRSQLILFHPVSDIPENQVVTEPLQFAGQAEIETRIGKLAAETSIHVPCEYVINIGLTEDEISDLVRERNIDLTIIGASLFNQALEAAVDLPHALPCPVLIVPEHIYFKPFIKIAFAVDLKPSMQSATIAPLVEIASRTGAEILVLNILAGSREISPDRAAEGIKLESLLENVNYSMHVLRSNDIAAGIENFVDVTRVDMVALIAHKYSFINNLFHRSTTIEIASRPSVPILALVE